MAHPRKRTFLPYMRGIIPEALRLGSLYLNPLEPDEGLASQRFEYMQDEQDQDTYEEVVKKWTWKRPEINRPFSMHFEHLTSASMGLSFADFLNLGGQPSKAEFCVVEGESGRCVKIRE